MLFIFLGIVVFSLLATGVAMYCSGDSIVDYVTGRERNEFHPDRKPNEYW